MLVHQRVTQIIPDLETIFQLARYVSFDPLQGFTPDPGVIQWSMS